MAITKQGGEAQQRVRIDDRQRRGWDTERAAEYCGISAPMLRKLRGNGEGPVYARIGKRVIYLPDDLDRWLDSQRVSPEAA